MNQFETPRRNRKAPLPDALTVSVERAGALLGISRAAAYKAVTAGHIPCLRFGRKIVVPLAALERMAAEVGKQPVQK